RTQAGHGPGMNAEQVPPGTLFARLLTDIMIPSQFSAAIRAQGYDVAEVRGRCEPKFSRMTVRFSPRPPGRSVPSLPATIAIGAVTFVSFTKNGAGRRKYTSELFSSHRHKSATVCNDWKCAIGCSGF